MASQEPPGAQPVDVAAVGLRPEQESGLMAELPQGDWFRLVAVSDEGLEAEVLAEPELAHA